MDVKAEKIKRYGDFQPNWSSLLPSLRKNRYIVEDPEARSIQGDAPKSFVKIKEYIPGHSNSKIKRWPAYIAKVGSKRYPVESITEHLLTRIGQAIGVTIAESRLLIMAGQVRFLSKYFLKPRDSLVHGLEIFRRHLDNELVEEIAVTRREREFYTFQTVLAAITDCYEPYVIQIMPPLVEMLAFDTIVGNNDRHPLNWGVIAPIEIERVVKFSPIFDSARGLFWNLDDSQLGKYIENEVSLNAYVYKSVPLIGFDGLENINHFDLIAGIYRDYPDYRDNLIRLATPQSLAACDSIVEGEFKPLMSDRRRHAIRRCLKRRFELYCEALK